MLDLYNLPKDDDETWDLISNGDTIGLFQIESPLGQRWCKEIKPKSIEELSDVVSVVRPGTLKAIQDGKSMTQHYADRKNNKDPIPSIHPIVDEILKDTQGILVYQEQSLKIAKEICGFSEQEADTLRKATGKKLPELMAKVKITFLEGAKKKGVVSEDLAAEIFEIIKKSERYSFNKSHGISYATTAYITAYLKAHYPLKFYCSWLNHAIDKQKPFEEIEKLVNDAKLHNIVVKVPDIRNPSIPFYIKDDEIIYGLCAVRGIGEVQANKLDDFIKKNKVENWNQFLIDLSDELSSTACVALIQCGAMDHFSLPRRRMEFEYSKWNLLSEKEKEFCRKLSGEFIERLKKLGFPKKLGGGCHNENRAKKIQEIVEVLANPPYNLVDDAEYLHSCEVKTMGVAITCNKVDDKDIIQANCTVKEFLDGYNTKNYSIAATVDEFVVTKIKNGQSKGKNMGILSISDSTGSMKNIWMFAEDLDQYDNILYKGNCVLLNGFRSKKGNLTVKQAFQL